MKSLIAALLLVYCCAAAGQLRTIPESAKEGKMRHVEAMVVEIDGERQRLAPGAQIRDESNRIVLPSAVAPGTPVKYLLDAEGLVRQVWILSPEEAAKP